MSSDRSAAGKRFQKWLFHEVIPPLTRHGIYPPPAETKGSSFAQLAEMLAQNSRLLADTIHKHEKLAEDVSQVKGKVENVEQRLDVLESGSAYHNQDVQTLNDRLAYRDIRIEEKHMPEVLAW
ncbi:hypothetical protein ACMGGR_04290 [Erwinia sp. BNK-24-b]|uniref:hypothetical protein n=1 Tax=unclassified Erwinia TaxID=2622719 RepID=UPI0039BF9326